jgi:hypothetical protein
MTRTTIKTGALRARGVFSTPAAAIACAVSYARSSDTGPLAPGAIERHRRSIGTPEQRRELLRWLQLSLIAMAITGATALVAGLLTAFVLGAP